ncbi:MAG: DUF6543 domain-containing protein [Pseudomonas sp.]
MLTPVAPVPPPFSQLPARAVQQRFASRPTLLSVIINALRDRLLEHYPTLDFDPIKIKLASPAVGGHWDLKPLSQVVIDHLVNPQMLDFTPQDSRAFFLTQVPPKHLDTAAKPHVDMQIIASIIAELPSTLYLDYQQALADYWSLTDDSGISRWQWFSEFLHDQLKAAALYASNLSDEQRDMVRQVTDWPDRVERSPKTSKTVYACFLETTLGKDDNEILLLGPEILLMREKQVLLCSVDGHVQPFDSLDDFGSAWGKKMQSEFLIDRLTWKRYEPNGNLFELQAGLILNRQLENLAALSFSSYPSEQDLAQRLDTLTDPATLFIRQSTAPPTMLAQLHSQLPDWLKQASATDRFAYRQHLLDLANVTAQSHGQSFNEGIEDIRSFSREALRAQIKQDHDVDYNPDDLVLDFAVAAGYPGGAGFIEHVRMSLTDLALKNLAGKPRGRLRVLRKDGQAPEDWLNEDYILGSNGLIQCVDIGTVYPQRIKTLLLSDTVDARRREALFTRELRVRLPMRALEYKVRKQCGLTDKGYRYVKALMGQTPSERKVDEQDIVIRPLAFHRKPGAKPDTVDNMFLIEPLDPNVGPHLLYRPLYAEALLEYPSRQAVLDAIAESGALQTSVLTWMADNVRDIYDNDGFKEPHIVRFHLGDEFERPRKPAPVTLANNDGADVLHQSLRDGRLLNYLFTSTARALVDLAERESVSNSESRWAVLMEGAWLLFNTLLLPLTRGPLMLAGWMTVLITSLKQDLPALDSDDPKAKELALIDLLLNTAMVLLHLGASSENAHQPLPSKPPEKTAPRLKPWRRLANHAEPMPAALVHQGSPGIPQEPVGGSHTVLDFTSSIATSKAADKLLNALLDFHVPWPQKLPPAEKNGSLKGLFRIDDTWHASIGGLFFQVSVVPGFAEVYLIDPAHSDRPGFKLASDGKGNWRLDRGLKLEGGMRGRLQAVRDENRLRLHELTTNKDRLKQALAPLVLSQSEARRSLFSAREMLDAQKKKLRIVWELLGKATPEQKVQLTSRHSQEVLKTAEAAAIHDRELNIYKERIDTLNAEMPKLTDAYNALIEVDRTRPYESERDNGLLLIWDALDIVHEQIKLLGRDLLQTRNGEYLSELVARFPEELGQEITTAYFEFVDNRRTEIEITNRLIESAKTLETTQEQAGEKLRSRKIVKHLFNAENYLPTSIKLHQLLSLKELVLERSCSSRDPAEYPFVMRLVGSSMESTVLSHMEICSSSGYATAEQIAVLENILKHYEEIDNAVRSLNEMASGFVRTEYQTPFLKQLNEAHVSAEEQLAALIRENEGVAPQSAHIKPIRAKPSTKRVFKSRNKGTLIGDIRPSRENNQGSFIDVQDPITEQKIASYMEHPEEGVWVEVVQGTPTQPTLPPGSRPLSAIKKEMHALIGQRAGIENSIRFQQKKLQDPGRLESLNPLDWNDMLVQYADKLNALADEIDNTHPAAPQAPQLSETLRNEALEATRQARLYCSEGYKKQLPKAENIHYLWKNGFVDINLVGRLIQTAAGDYLTEYAVREKNTFNVLWYAHFHYASLDMPRPDYSIGHLKLPEQRFLTRKDLIRQAAADNRAVANLEKSLIKPPLDETLFLKL